jgi:hypothetical protein
VKLLVAGGLDSDARDGVVSGEIVWAPDGSRRFVGLASGGTTTAAVVREVEVTGEELRALVLAYFARLAAKYVEELTAMPASWPAGTIVHRWGDDGDQVGPP